MRRGIAVVTAVMVHCMATGLLAQSLQQRISEAQAGSVIVVEPGEYSGPLVIRKPVKLMGKGRPVIRGDGSGHVVHVLADDVTLEGFRVQGSGMNLDHDDAAIIIEGNRAVIRDNHVADSLHGIYLKKAQGCRIVGNVVEGKTHKIVPVDIFNKHLAPDGAEFCRIDIDQNRRGNGIHLWQSSDTLIANNIIRDTRDGIYFSFSHRSQVQHNRIERVRYGLHYMYSNDNFFDDNVFSENAAGAAIMYSQGVYVRGNRFVSNRGSRAYGLLMQSVDHSRIEANQLTGNTVGIYLENSNANVLLGNTITRNYIGIRLSLTSARNTFSRNVIAYNMHPVETSGNDATNRWQLRGVGNTWQYAEQLDFNLDGIGDLPHRVVDVFGGIRREFPWIALLSNSPAVHLLRYVNQRLPLRAMPGIVDRRPLVSERLAND